MIPRKVATTHSETIDREMCVYEWTRKEVHALNPTAARVWQMCDGRTSVTEMAAVLRTELGVPHADDLVWLALTEFREKRLIEDDRATPLDRSSLSRRALIAKLGLTAAMLPVVTSIVAPTALQAQSLTSQTFDFVPASLIPQPFTVPAGVTTITVDASGGNGGPTFNAASSQGGRVQATIAVTPGETLEVRVGGFGNDVFSNAGGNFGGGDGGFGCAGGGGFSDVRRGTTRLVVAGGGGGYGVASNPGGPGGGLVGANGTTAAFPGSGGGGGGGTQSAPGAGGAAGSGADALAGMSGSGENGGRGAGPYSSGVARGGGGGGGGYFGGGGGGGYASTTLPPVLAGGGGGGSSYTDPLATSVVHTQGGNTTPSGNGRVVISW